MNTLTSLRIPFPAQRCFQPTDPLGPAFPLFRPVATRQAVSSHHGMNNFFRGDQWGKRDSRAPLH
jgi:hypothetical protein